MPQSRGLELLAPARNADTAREAILHGADAIYIGGPSHSARAAAANSIDDIHRLIDFAHPYGVRVYVTLNTIIYEHELREVERTVHDLYRIGTDALIVQDMGLLRLDIPPIDLHASTQCDIRTIEKAQFLARCGFSQLVLPRELTLDEIQAFRKAIPANVDLEAFVHGALCVSYSGDCQASWAACRRSANRGECAQMCRLPYSLTDADGHVIIKDKHLLSLRDLNRLHDLDALAQAGISSFKIEGRLKDIAYVKTVTAAYSQAIDNIIANNPNKYHRQSMGRCQIAFVPDIEKAFNRGFTSYFIQRPAPSETMACFDTPKWIGKKVGNVVKAHGNIITARLVTPINNGDGLGYFTPQGKYLGVRVNRAQGSRLFTASPIEIPSGTTLYRNSDTKHDALLTSDTGLRKIDLDLTLTAHARHDGNLCVTLTLTDDYNHKVQSTTILPQQEARTTQTEARSKALTKLGNTIYTSRQYTDQVDPLTFIPASALSALRRQAIVMMSHSVIATHPYRYRRPEDMQAIFPQPITYHNNVANSRAAQFYTDHGAEVKQQAIEVATPFANKSTQSFSHTASPAIVPDGTTVMTTRYCLRRELGACLKTPSANKLPQPLYLTTSANKYQLAFDCKNCQMSLLKCSKI